MDAVSLRCPGSLDRVLKNTRGRCKITKRDFADFVRFCWPILGTFDLCYLLIEDTFVRASCSLMTSRKPCGLDPPSNQGRGHNKKNAKTHKFCPILWFHLYMCGRTEHVPNLRFTPERCTKFSTITFFIKKKKYYTSTSNSKNSKKFTTVPRYPDTRSKVFF